MNEAAPIGVALVGHGSTASQLLAAARAIVAPGSLSGVIAIDAGLGETPSLTAQLCTCIATADYGRGVLVLVDLLGASPCQCVQREAHGHPLSMVSGLNLAMLLKLASIDRSRFDLRELAVACAEAGRRAVVVTERPDPKDAMEAVERR